MLALLLRGIQMRDVKDSVMAVQVWNQWVLRQRKWEESSVVHRIPTDYIKLFTLPIVD